MADKIYCGNAKFIKTQYGEMLKISLSASDLEKLTDNLQGGWVNAVVKAKKEPVEGKPTHYLEIDTWQKPTEPQAATQQAAQAPPPEQVAPPAATPNTSDDLPF